jgi:hypothetical protein
MTPPELHVSPDSTGESGVTGTGHVGAHDGIEEIFV